MLAAPASDAVFPVPPYANGCNTTKLIGSPALKVLAAVLCDLPTGRFLQSMNNGSWISANPSLGHHRVR